MLIQQEPLKKSDVRGWRRHAACSPPESEAGETLHYSWSLSYSLDVPELLSCPPGATVALNIYKSCSIFKHASECQVNNTTQGFCHDLCFRWSTHRVTFLLNIAGGQKAMPPVGERDITVCQSRPGLSDNQWHFHISKCILAAHKCCTDLAERDLEQRLMALLRVWLQREPDCYC